jgi:hypothetical protein
MVMKLLSFAVIALVSAAGLSAQSKKSEPIHLRGCVGEGMDRGTYYVANLTRVATSDMSIGTEPDAIYALDSPKKLKPHVNKQVDIMGTVEARKNSGAVGKKDGATTIDAKGRRTTRIPEGTAAAAAASSGGANRTTYKVKVSEVTEVPGGASCK